MAERWLPVRRPTPRLDVFLDRLYIPPPSSKYLVVALHRRKLCNPTFILVGILSLQFRHVVVAREPSETLGGNGRSGGATLKARSNLNAEDRNHFAESDML